MTKYRVTFFKNLLSSDGHPFKCPQRTVEVHRAKSIERALAAAQHRYQRLTGDRDWRLHADTAEMEVMAEADERTRHKRSWARSGAEDHYRR